MKPALLTSRRIWLPMRPPYSSFHSHTVECGAASSLSSFRRRDCTSSALYNTHRHTQVHAGTLYIYIQLAPPPPPYTLSERLAADVCALEALSLECPLHDELGRDVEAGAHMPAEAGLAEVMAAMDLELRGHQQGRSDFELEPEAGMGASTASGAEDAHGQASSAAADAAGAGASGEPAHDESDLRPVDLDLNLVKNLLASYSAQQGLAGPVSNLLGSMGLKLPDDQDEQEQAAATRVP